MAREKSTLRLSPKRQRRFVQNAEQQIPERVAGFLDFIEQHEADLHSVGVILVQHFLAQQRVRLAMPQISGRRADQLRDLMAVLELRAIDLDHGARILHQRFGSRLDDPGLTGTGRPEKKEVADRPPGSAHPGQIHLIDIHDLLDRFVLTDDVPI